MSRVAQGRRAYKVSDDLADTSSTSQWKLALWQDLVCVSLRDVVHDDNDLGLVRV